MYSVPSVRFDDHGSRKFIVFLNGVLLVVVPHTRLRVTSPYY